jgi:transposase-like protein
MFMTRGKSGEEAGMEDKSNSAPALVDLSEAQRRQAMTRFAMLRPYLEGDAPLAYTARDAGVPIRTVERWLTRYRRDGLAGLTRRVRGDAGTHRLPPDLVTLIEGMGLKKPRSSAALIHRRVAKVAEAKGWPSILRHGACDPRPTRPCHGLPGAGRVGDISRPP